MIPARNFPENRYYHRPVVRPRPRRLLWLTIPVILAVVVLALVAISLRPKGPSGTGDDDDLRPPVNPPPSQDTDKDGLSDQDEMHKYGTNITNPDTDGDGMSDGWEVRQTGRAPLTGELLIDALDPRDVYEDPDNDGYDFNHNGYVDGSEQDQHYKGYDMVALSWQKFPASPEYTTYNLNQLLANLEEHQGELVRIANARVVDNGSFGGLAQYIDSTISINVTDPSTNMQVAVLLQPRSDRPVGLSDDTSGIAIPASIVDIQGIFERTDLRWHITVRGSERFTNLMEYLSARDYDNDGPVNRTDPTNWDTDGDLMSDGWEAYYGRGQVDFSSSPPRWEWTVHLDPTNASDGGTGDTDICDLDGDLMQAPDGRWVGYNRDEYLVIINKGLLSILPREKWNLADILARKDMDRKGYAYGTDPSQRDTDRDSFDRDNDGHDPGYDNNTEDFVEIFLLGTDPTNADTDGDTMWDGWEDHYGLCATSPNDKFEDPDGDQLQNYQEFRQRTNPSDPDTDHDGMPDGWEVEYGLDPLDPGDKRLDSDVVDIAGTPVSRPDGLINLYEYQNGTDPRNPDSDGDHLSDYEEIAIGWDIEVEGKQQHYFTCASRRGGLDTDSDTKLGPPLPNGSPAGPAGTEFLYEGDYGQKQDLSDWNEVMYYHTNASSPDTDGDGLCDPVELFSDREPDTMGFQATDPCKMDTDGDGLGDQVEVAGLKLWLPFSVVPQTVVTSPLRSDTDGDGLADGFEVLHDFLPQDVSGKSQSYIRLDREAGGPFTPVYDPEVGKRVDCTNPSDPDTDEDGLPDGYEFNSSDPDCDGLPSGWELLNGAVRLSPFKQDTDDNGIPDMMEDFDGDGLINLEEYRHRTDPLDPDSAIPGLERPPGVPNPKSRAGNGVKDGDEGGLLRDKSQPYSDIWGHPLVMRQPLYSDSDGDLMPDWWEILHKLNPRANDRWDDLDNDGFANLDEYIYGTDPELPDTNGNGIADWKDHPFTYHQYATDRDNDFIGDWWERYYFGGPCDPGGNADGPWDPGSGRYGDNWTNQDEWSRSKDGIGRFRTSPVHCDTDGDGQNDDFDPDPVRIPYVAVPMGQMGSGVRPLSPVVSGDRYGDIDQDDLSNLEEFSFATGPLDPADPDSDQDGMPDGWEVRYGLDPLDPSDALKDPDNDGVNYSLNWIDRNGNHVPDAGEYTLGSYDLNGDGRLDPFNEDEHFSNVEEYRFGLDIDADGINEVSTDPNKADTDGDGLLDGYSVACLDSDDDGLPNLWELRYGFDPLDPSGIDGPAGDPDGDGFGNIEEFLGHTDPRDPSSHPTIEGRAQDE